MAGQRSCGAQELQAEPTVRQLLDCASPLALSHAHASESKAPEDWRSPRRSALSRPGRTFASLVNVYGNQLPLASNSGRTTDHSSGA